MLRELRGEPFFKRFPHAPCKSRTEKEGANPPRQRKQENAVSRRGLAAAALLLRLCAPFPASADRLAVYEPRPFLKRSETAAKAVCLTDRRTIAESEAFTGRGHMWFLFAILLSIIPRLVFAVIVFAKISGEVVFHIGFPQEKSARRAKKRLFLRFFQRNFMLSTGFSHSLWKKPLRKTYSNDGVPWQRGQIRNAPHSPAFD